MKAADPITRFYALALMTVGGLLAGTSGLCTVGLVGSGLMFFFKQPSANVIGMLIPLLFGLPMIVLGYTIFNAGLSIWRRPPPTSPVDPTVFDQDAS